MKPNESRVPRSRQLCAALTLTVLTAATAAAAERAAELQRAEQSFAGAPLTQERAARLALDAGVELIDVRPCARRPERCARFAVLGADGEAAIYEVTAERCEPADETSPTARPADRRKPERRTPTESALTCFGGFAVAGQVVGARGRPSSPASAAKISAKPGEDGAPPDPQDEAQAEATNEIIESLGDGNYEGNYEQFWADLESIQTWESPSWIEPDPPPPDTIEGQALPSALDDCRQERRALERNESKCNKPPLNPIGGSTCTGDMLTSFTPQTDNLVISNWDWELDQFVYFGSPHPSPTEQDLDFLVAVWNFLVKHRNIAEWAVCLVEGPSNGRCVEKRLAGDTTQPYEFVDRLPVGCPKTAGMCTAFIGRKTSIKLTSWDGDRDRFFDPGSSDAKKLCLLATNAAVLLHEMLHSCLAVFTQNADDFGVGPGECGCDTPDMAEAAFAWAVAQRYPCLATTADCGFLDDDDMWLTPCDFSYNCPPPC